MKCKWKDCDNETRTRSEFCSDTCSKRFRRNPDKPGHVSDLAKPGQPDTHKQNAQVASRVWRKSKRPLTPGQPCTLNPGEQDEVLAIPITSPSTQNPDAQEPAQSTISVEAYETITAHTVYNRQAVSYQHDKFRTRPEPLDVTDTPCPCNRGRYTRLDGSQYQFDCLGHDFPLTNGLLYQTTEEVKACYLCMKKTYLRRKGMPGEGVGL